jgi:hypothetical protein
MHPEHKHRVGELDAIDGPSFPSEQAPPDRASPDPLTHDNENRLPSRGWIDRQVSQPDGDDTKPRGQQRVAKAWLLEAKPAGVMPGEVPPTPDQPDMPKPTRVPPDNLPPNRDERQNDQLLPEEAPPLSPPVRIEDPIAKAA